MRPPGRQTRQHFAGGCVLVGREHDAEGREHDVVRRVAERKVFRVGLAALDRHVLGGGACGGAFEERADVVRRRHFTATTSGGERHVAVAGGDVEDALTGRHVDRFAQGLADDLQGGADHGVVARCPRALLLRLDGFEIDGGGCSGGHAVIVRESAVTVIGKVVHSVRGWRGYFDPAGRSLSPRGARFRVRTRRRSRRRAWRRPSS